MSSPAATSRRAENNRLPVSTHTRGPARHAHMGEAKTIGEDHPPSVYAAPALLIIDEATEGSYVSSSAKNVSSYTSATENVTPRRASSTEAPGPKFLSVQRSLLSR